MTKAHADIAEILGKVRAWPAGQRLALTQQILQTIETDVEPSSGQRKSLKDLLGAMHTPETPPDDAACRRLLEGELQKKYGR